jgi:hypothetical protein
MISTMPSNRLGHTINFKNAAPVVASDNIVRLKYGCTEGSLNSGAATDQLTTGILLAVATLLMGIVCVLSNINGTQEHRERERERERERDWMNTLTRCQS